MKTHPLPAVAITASVSLTALLTLIVSSADAAVTTPFTGVTLVSHGDRVLAIADLCAAGVSMRATKFAERKATPQGWATRGDVNAAVAVNADFFDFPGWTYVVGRARGAGEDWPVQNKENRSYWQFGPTLAQFIEPATPDPVASATEVIGGHNTLIRNGQSLAPGFDGDAVITTSHRRTAIGIDAGQTRVYLFASDASLNGSEIVASVVQMASEGGAPAVYFLTNQDGGGSSQMYVRGQGQIIDSGRLVNNHLGIIANGSGPSPMCNHPPRGAFDAAACDYQSGWAQDQDAPTQPLAVHIYFNGPAGAAGTSAIVTTANVERPDLVAAVGSSNHGFHAMTPYGIFDGKAHDVFAYAINANGGANPQLGQKSLTCVAAAPKSMRRHVTSPDVYNAWKFSDFVDTMPLTDEAIQLFEVGADIDHAPELINSDDKSPEVWLVDGTARRHVINVESAAAWHLDLSKVVTKPAAEVNALTHGPDLPLRPLLTRSTDGAVYVLDPMIPPATTTLPDGGAQVVPNPDSPNAPTDGDATGGCAVGRVTLGPFAAGCVAFLGMIATLRRRRRTR